MTRTLNLDKVAREIAFKFDELKVDQAAKALYAAVVLDRHPRGYPDWDSTSQEIRDLYIHFAKVTINAYK